MKLTTVNLLKSMPQTYHLAMIELPTKYWRLFRVSGLPHIYTYMPFHTLCFCSERLKLFCKARKLRLTNRSFWLNMNCLSWVYDMIISTEIITTNKKNTIINKITLQINIVVCFLFLLKYYNVRLLFWCILRSSFRLRPRTLPVDC